jgi:hypothetical protein
MKIEELYLTKIIPFLNDFKRCEIYNYELKKLDQELAESMGQKNIYTALDLPDFKSMRELKLEPSIIKLTCKKLNIGKEVIFDKENGINILNIDSEKYQLIFFPSGTVPEIDIKLENIIFFMYQPKFQKIYYCGKQNLKKLTKTVMSDFYTNHCLGETKKFIDFKSLTR